MDPRQRYSDARFSGICVYCGDKPSTRDHVPSKVLLDEPFPPDLPVVPACLACNNGFSADELYVACLLETVVSGTVDHSFMSRDKMKRALASNPALASRIEAGRHVDADGNCLWAAEVDRVQNVILKLARGHAAHQYSELQLEEPGRVTSVPIVTMSEQEIGAFENPPSGGLLPEIGSRGFVQMLVVDDQLLTGEGIWRTVQKGRYRYAISHTHGIQVRMVLRDYLACEVLW